MSIFSFITCKFCILLRTKRSQRDSNQSLENKDFLRFKLGPVHTPNHLPPQRGRGISMAPSPPLDLRDPSKFSQGWDPKPRDGTQPSNWGPV